MQYSDWIRRNGQRCVSLFVVPACFMSVLSSSCAVRCSCEAERRVWASPCASALPPLVFFFAFASHSLHSAAPPKSCPAELSVHMYRCVPVCVTASFAPLFPLKMSTGGRMIDMYMFAALYPFFFFPSTLFAFLFVISLAVLWAG